MNDKITNHNKIKTTLVVLSLVFALAFPALNNMHFDPEPQFWMEMTAAWGIVILFLVTVYSYQTIAIPSVSIPLILFAIYSLLQSHLIHVEFLSVPYVVAIEMFICLLFAISINTLRLHFGFEKLLTYISIGFIIGALLQSSIGFTQYTGLYKHLSFIFYDSEHPTTNIFGHFGQRNHYAHYLSWAVFASIYLFCKRSINKSTFFGLILWFSFSLTIAGSRSVLLYFAMGILIAFITWLIKRDKETQKIFLVILLSSIILVLFQYAYPLIIKLLTHSHSLESGLNRIADANSSGDGIIGRRKTEWLKAWMVFKEHPIFGVGWGGFPQQSVWLHQYFPNAATNSGLFTNCHNVVLQLLAETGIIGAGIFVLGVITITTKTIKNNTSKTAVILLLCMMMTTLIHALDEYPLWYLYFLSALIMFLSCDKPMFIVSHKKIIALFVLPVAYLIYFMVVSSFVFDKLVSYMDVPDDSKQFTTQTKYLENLANTSKLWEYVARYDLDNYITVDDEDTDDNFTLEEQFALTKKFADYHPYPDTMIKEAMLAFNLGDKKLAHLLVTQAVLAFPVYKASFRTTLSDEDHTYHELQLLIK